MQQAKPGTSARLAAQTSNVHLLAVDDDESVVKLYGRFLSESPPLRADGGSITLHTASTGEEALEIARKLRDDGRVACALVDVDLGNGLGGIETIRKLWDLDPDTECTVVTGLGSSIEERVLRELPPGFCERWDFLAKPFTGFEIMQRTRRSLGAWFRQRREEERRAENLCLLRRLQEANEDLEDAVRARTQTLGKRNAELERALRDLKAAQNQLLQQEKMASIGQLAAGIAHELNNPIGFVHSNLETLRRYGEKVMSLMEAYAECEACDTEELVALRKTLKIDFVFEDLPALIAESLEGADRVRRIVGDLKAFSHPSEHEARLCDVTEGLEATLNIVHNEIKYKAKVTTELAELPAVRCVPGHINQVFMNLLVNAAQAIEGNDGEIHVRSRTDAGDVVFTFSDNGCGIPDEYRRRIFDPFFTTKEVGTGTGLGLSISYDIVRQHGGRMTVESEVGKGTTFTIRLPVDGVESGVR